MTSKTNQLIEQLSSFIETLNWDTDNDNIVLEIGGVAVTGTSTHPNANPKWAKPFGTVTYQSDAFIIIKNKSRSPKIDSVPNPELKQHHEYIRGN